MIKPKSYKTRDRIANKIHQRIAHSLKTVSKVKEYVSSPMIIVFCFLALIGILAPISYQYQRWADPHKLYGMITYGGQEQNYTRYVGGIEQLVELTDCTSGECNTQNRTMLVGYFSYNDSSLFNYEIAKRRVGREYEYMTNEGGKVVNREIFNWVKEQDTAHQGHIIFIIGMFGIVIYQLIIAIHGFKRHQGTFRPASKKEW